MEDIRFRKTSVAWPQACACCLAPSTHTLATERTKRLFLGVATVSRTFSVDVPYCSPCVQHVLWSVGGGMSGVVVKTAGVAFAAVFVGTLVTLLCTQVVPAILMEIAPQYGSLNGAPPTVGFVLGPLFSCATPLLVAALYARARLKRRPPGGILQGTHASAGRSVEVRDFDAESLTLTVYDDRYADLLRKANP